MIFLASPLFMGGMFQMPNIIRILFHRKKGLTKTGMNLDQKKQESQTANLDSFQGVNVIASQSSGTTRSGTASH